MVKKIKVASPENVPLKQEPPHIIFDFSMLSKLSYIDAKNDSKFFISFLNRLSELSKTTWNTVNTSARHSYGWEIIERQSFSKAAQERLPAGVDKLMVFRVSGDNHVFLGIRDTNVFKVIFIEYSFGDIYSHGKK